MCPPLIAALAPAAGAAGAASGMSLAIQGISAIGSAVSTISAANKQNEAVAQNAQSAKDAYFMKTRQANLRVLQEQNKASEMKQDADLKALKSQGTAIAAAAGGGVQGANVDQLINDFERSEGVLSARTDSQLKGMQAQNEMEKLAFQSEATNRINSMQPVGFAETLFKVAAPIAGFGIDYYDTKARYASIDL
jgi:hypothetical protein